MFNHFYPDRFPSLWEKFESLKSENKIVSVREVENEINTYLGTNRLTEWAKKNRDFFAQPTQEELLIVTEIFKIAHFQTLIREKKRLKGEPVADPFVVAKAKACNGCVVTEEQWKKDSGKLPNVCQHFDIPCINLEEFMKREGWTF
ncbi:MAG: DUF4411 family protein [Candidatus Aminicenantes bacterium]